MVLRRAAECYFDARTIQVDIYQKGPARKFRVTQKEIMIVALTVALLTFLTVTCFARGRDHHHSRRQGPPTDAVYTREVK